MALAFGAPQGTVYAIGRAAGGGDAAAFGLGVIATRRKVGLLADRDTPQLGAGRGSAKLEAGR